MIDPDVAVSSPASRFNSVDFPEPDLPTIDTNCPVLTEKEIPFTAGIWDFPLE